MAKASASKSPGANVNRGNRAAPVVPSAPAGSKDPAPLADEATLAALARAAPKDDKLKPTEGVVARGHTVTTGEGTFTVGERFTASKGEIEKMRKRGVCVDPNRIPAPLGSGPQFLREDEAAKGAKEPGQPEPE